MPDSRPYGSTLDRGAERDPNAWIAPLIATLLTVAAGSFAAVVAMFSPMVCDSCSAPELDRLETLFSLYVLSMLIPVVLLIVDWALPWRRRHSVTRIVVAALAPCSVVALVVLYIGLLGSVRG
ncbi:hypothetical protein [Streptomyces sp. NPDC048650]|uniref:hypothetical protein n=1 Tax=unclassified Streptomyces TaxID=2593676 RepID=UPI003715066E